MGVVWILWMRLTQILSKWLLTHHVLLTHQIRVTILLIRVKKSVRLRKQIKLASSTLDPKQVYKAWTKDKAYSFMLESGNWWEYLVSVSNITIKNQLPVLLKPPCWLPKLALAICRTYKDCCKCPSVTNIGGLQRVCFWIKVKINTLHLLWVQVWFRPLTWCHVA